MGQRKHANRIDSVEGYSWKRWWGKFEADLCLSMIWNEKKLFHVIFLGTDIIRQYSKRAKLQRQIGQD